MFKRLPVIFLLLFASLWGNAQLQLYVSPTGNDLSNGSINQPFASLSKALLHVRELRRLNDASIKQGAYILLKEGVYILNESIIIRPEDAGTQQSPTIIQAADDAEHPPILSGGVQIKNWKKLTTLVNGLPKESLGKVWVADVPLINGNDFLFRQLWVNNTKAILAKDTKGDLMNRIISWNKKEQTCFIPTPKFSLQNTIGAEMFIHQWWAIAVLRIKKFEVHGDSTKLFFHQPESKIQSEHPWPAPWISKETGNSAFYLTNAIQFLDEEGEWFLDVKKHKLYYYPRSNEDVNKAAVIASNLETLIKVEGTIDNLVSNIHFKGISFQHTGWLRPSLQGHVPHQAGMYMTEAYKLRPAGTKENPKLDNQAWIGRPAAAVQLDFVSNTSFEYCQFEHIGSTGLDYHKGVHSNTIKGNLFKDISGTAILAGVFTDEGKEIHLAYQPKDEREVCDSMLITNNLITNATNEDWSCVGIGAGYVKNITIEHNEVEHVSYTGISMGWGWNAAPNPMKNNQIIGNKIHHYGKHNYDCAGIYTLSAQPNSVIALNYIDSIYKAPYAHLPSHWFYIYTDEGSSGITVIGNWTPSKKYLQNANGPGNVWENNGPQVDASIKQKAGLQVPFQYLTKEKTSTLLKQPINEEHNEVIELIVKANQQLNLPKLKQFLAQNNMDSTAIYQWQNHFVVFSKVNDLGVMQGRLQNNFPEAEVKVYHDMFYEYSKKKNCIDTSTAREWQHIILTANLVADKKLQQEYLDYHATQFEKWKEVSNGFCNASFQQLLIFKNGRQLVLVISIPKGESLDKLNPKTTENNPRVNDWNKLMGKYQEGIEGTKKGETWVFLKLLAPKGE
jgi:hypothetical protein